MVQTCKDICQRPENKAVLAGGIPKYKFGCYRCSVCGVWLTVNGIRIIRQDGKYDPDKRISCKCCGTLIRQTSRHKEKVVA